MVTEIVSYFYKLIFNHFEQHFAVYIGIIHNNILEAEKEENPTITYLKTPATLGNLNYLLKIRINCVAGTFNSSRFITGNERKL